MKSKTEIITPEMAMDWLENHNPRNRPISEPTVQVYAGDMKNGRWSLTHQGIAFNVNGDLIDGQHRLWAIVFSGKNVEMMVTRDLPLSEVKNGVEINPMDAVDRTRPRGVGIGLQLSHGIKRGNNVAAAVRGIAYMVNPGLSHRRLSSSNTLFIYDIFGKDIEAVAESVDGKKHVSHFVAPLAFYHRMEPSRTLDFCHQMVTLEGLCAPVRSLVKYMSENPSVNHEKKLRVTACHIHAFHEQKSSMPRVYDSNSGVEFLVSQFPSVVKKIREATKPIEGKILTFKTITA